MTYISETEINQYMFENKKYFENSEFERFKNIIADSDITVQELNGFKFKSPAIGVVLSLALGWCGADRFYSGNYISGGIKLFTFGCWGIWWIIDWFLIRKAVRINNQTRFYAFLQGENRHVTYNVNADNIKNVLKSKEVRHTAKELWESHKRLMDSWDIES